MFDQDGNSYASHRSSFSKQAVTGSTNPLREVQQVTDVVEKLPRAELPEPFLWAFLAAIRQNSLQVLASSPSSSNFLSLFLRIKWSKTSAFTTATAELLPVKGSKSNFPFPPKYNVENMSERKRLRLWLTSGTAF